MWHLPQGKGPTHEFIKTTSKQTLGAGTEPVFFISLSSFLFLGFFWHVSLFRGVQQNKRKQTLDGHRCWHCWCAPVVALALNSLPSCENDTRITVVAIGAYLQLPLRMRPRKFLPPAAQSTGRGIAGGTHTNTHTATLSHTR